MRPRTERGWIALAFRQLKATLLSARATGYAWYDDLAYYEAKWLGELAFIWHPELRSEQKR